MWRLVITLLALSLAACAQKGMMRDTPEECQIKSSLSDKDSLGKECLNNSTVSYKSGNRNFKLHFVEFTDQGHFHSRDQFFAMLERVKNAGGNQDIILYIHGWNNDARPNNSNVIKFTQLLGSISERNRSRTVTGIFVGWRGASIDVELLNKLTFWDRKNVSIEIGRGSVIELIERLRIAGGYGKGSRMISIGHSFGASVLLSATKNELYKAFLPPIDQEGSFYSLLAKVEPIDYLTILVNPAIEATPFLALRDLVEENKRRLQGRIYNQPTGPKVAIFTSESDWAVKYAFPAGRYLSTPLESYQTLERSDRHGNKVHYDEKSMDVRSVGRFEQFQTHRLTTSGASTAADGCVVERQNWATDVLGGQTNEKWVGTFKWSGTTLTHLGNSPAFSPAWVVSVSPDVIDGHGDIWNNRFNCFLEELILVENRPKTPTLFE